LVERLLIRPTHRAASEIRRASAWWRANRPGTPLALVEDLERAFELVGAQPGLGALARNTKKAGVRRLFLSRTGYHLYYQVSADANRVEILALWHAHRGRDPSI
jgi:plasmid stabilization system protein ParE